MQMTTKLADIEFYIIDLSEHFGFKIKSINFEVKKVDKIITDGIIRYLPTVREVLVVSFDLVVREDQQEQASEMTNTLEDYLSSKVEYHYLSGNYYINH